MDVTPAPSTPKYVRWLPYWAVFQTDLRQTFSSWAYRAWLAVTLLTAVGFLLYRFGVYKEAGLVQMASVVLADMLKWTLLASVALIVVLTGGSIAAERGTLADSVLSRGISRYQYFMAKWHARLLAVMGTFVPLVSIALVVGHFLLHEDLSLTGCVIGLAALSSMMMAVISAGVAVSALTTSTVLGITVLWVVLYGCGFLLSLVPQAYLVPDRFLSRLPHILAGNYDPSALTQVIAVGAGVSVVMAIVGMIGFARRDV